MSFFSNKVPPTYNKSERLDKYIANLSNGMNRSKLKSGVVSILVNGKNQKVSYKVRPGDQIDIQWEENIPDNIEPQNIPLDIIYEDDNVCVVNKEQGMVTHPACGNWEGTLVNALLYHWGRQAIKELKEGSAGANEILANRRPGIVHRLDKETSGIIITAKNRDTEEYLASLFRNHRKLQKEYIAICMGRPQHHHGVVKTQIIRDPRDRKKFRAAVDTEEGKYAETHYKCIACYGEYSLMRLRIVTGRTHQIRVHMKYLNCPVLGDGLYAKPDRKFPHATLMLNAHKLAIKLPGDSQRSVFKSRTPKRFREIMKVLHRDFTKVILPRDR
ncbi:MAG: RluA family pseudouridine synthase [Treponema sp.]|nr:RluA family pseudouridine synthase [Candidatus Treponema equi]